MTASLCRLFVFALLGCAVGVAWADSTNLGGGALVTHYVPEIVYSSTPPPCGDWCCAYDGHEIADPAQENIRIDAGTTAVWYILSAWTEDKEWCGVEFGFGNYSTSLLGFYESGPCFPDQGLELPTAGWPGPDEGTALVTTVVPWTGNWIPVYYFACYAYSGAGMLPVDVDPTTGFVGFANCENPSQTFEVPPNTASEFYRGAMGINTDGIRAAPSTIPSAVCCIDTWCLVQTQAGCDDLGGVWHEEWGESCDPNPCDPIHVCCFGTTTFSCGLLTHSACQAMPGPGVWHEEWDSCDPDPCKIAACCTDDLCTLRTELECLDAGGNLWLENIDSCDPNPCLASACCIDRICQLLTQEECNMAGGIWQGGAYPCDPNPCIPSVCCYAYQQCAIVTHGECDLMSGTWHPEWLSCDPNPCIPGGIWACCLDEDCILMNAGDCAALGGVWVIGSLCDPSPCEIKACCYGYGQEQCDLLIWLQCQSLGGEWLPNVESCDPTPCAVRACCGSTGQCTLVTELECNGVGGRWLPEQTACDPNPCPQVYIVRPDGSGDFPTIQAALNAVNELDEILLTDGVFVGAGNRDLNFRGKAVTVRSQSGDPTLCRIDCQGSASSPHRIVNFRMGEGPQSVLQGVGLTGGFVFGPNVGPQGGAIRCISSSPTIRGCLIYGNRADLGGAIYCENASPVLEGCTIALNGPVGQDGGGIACAQYAAPVMEKTIIAFSLAGPAVSCDASSVPVVACCDFFGNPGGDWIPPIADQLGQNGNLWADPFFCNLATRDFRLSCDSPCLEAPGCGLIGALGEGCDFYGITSVRDVPNDQGRAVRIRWRRTCSDRAGGDPPITSYSIWRRVEGPAERANSGASELGGGAPVRSFPPGEWEHLQTVPACGELQYATICATLCDSTASGICWSAFFIRALTEIPAVYFDTEPDSGYSIDNLAPEPPGNLRFETPQVLTWDPCPAADFDHFTVYGTAGEQFDSSAVVIGRTISTTMHVSDAGYPCYHVTATDVSGNQGLPSTVCDFSGLDPTQQLPTQFALGSCLPNPFTGHTRISFDLPIAAEVDLRVFDAAGRLAATLINGPQPPGRHHVLWEANTDGDRRGVGIYFVRLRAGQFEARQRVVLLQ